LKFGASVIEALPSVAQRFQAERQAVGDRVGVAVGDLPHAVLTPEHKSGAQRCDDRVVVAGDPALVPLDL
jgi:hypothetical protein